MRVSVTNGNGYECDICHTLLTLFEVYRVKCMLTADSTGGIVTKDTIGCCKSCYEKHFSILNGRGLAREVIGGKQRGIKGVEIERS